MEILYVKIVNRKIEVRTDSGIVQGSLTNQLDFILSHFGFEKVNQDIIINMNKVTTYDSENSIVYFNKEKTILCEVSRSNRHKLST